MVNEHVQQRLQNLLAIAKAVHSGGSSLSSASKGTEREWFVNNILNNIIAPPFRVGSGDITDATGNKTGQTDIVIEYGNSISVPIVNENSPRLYLAEGVCAVIEVKSDVSNQWDQVQESHKALSPLRRHFSSYIALGSQPTDYIPHFVVAYKGWKTLEKLKEKVEEGDLDGILVLDSELYYGKLHWGNQSASLFAFLITMQNLTSSMLGAKTDYLSYYSSAISTLSSQSP